MKCSLRGFYNIICISSMFYVAVYDLDIPAFMLPVCWGG